MKGPFNTNVHLPRVSVAAEDSYTAALRGHVKFFFILFPRHRISFPRHNYLVPTR